MSTTPDAASVRGAVERWRSATARLQTVMNAPRPSPVLLSEAFALEREAQRLASRLRELQEQQPLRRI